MTILGKKQMSEEDIKLNYITPVILDGWKGHVTMETKITDGRINISGNIVARSKPKFADYMLYLNDGKPIAVVEAKDNNQSVSHGLQQAMTYHLKEAEALRKKNRWRNILRFIWSIVWKLGVLVGITALAIYLESKCNSKIPMYISMGVNAVGVIYTLWSALKKDKEKYLKKDSGKSTSA